MKRLTRLFALFIFIAVLTTISIYAQDSNKDNKIIRIVDLYQQELNTNNVEGVLRLFTDDGILLPQGAQTSIGTKALEMFYSSLFKTLDFDLKFNIDEIIQMSPEWAFVRTTSTGMVKVISNNSNNPSEGHELFILKKQADGTWKIARYAGSSAK